MSAGQDQSLRNFAKWADFAAGCMLLGILAIVMVANGPNTQAGKEWRERIEAGHRLRIASWEAYRDANCSQVRAEMRRFYSGAGITHSWTDKPVRVWRCETGAMFDEIDSQVPRNWRNPLSGGGSR